MTLLGFYHWNEELMWFVSNIGCKVEANFTIRIKFV